ncbi:MAG TPA: DotH/IcmK family type IV secretion protein [Legionellaceae bacterium]|nr:DotH/IcmK family type IV secretion protein [Legionellaceae bacterium]
MMGCLVSPVIGASNTDSSAQALDQLRLLQKKLAKDSPNMVQEPESHAPIAPAPTAHADTRAAAVAKAAAVVRAQQEERLRAMKKAAHEKEAQAAIPPTLLSSMDESKAVDELAFKNVEGQLFPLDPERIQELRKKYNQTEFAKNTDIETPPKPTATSQFVNLSPGSTPPVIRLSQGFVSSLVFLDSTGAPWPISAFDLGDPSSFNIQWDKTSNTLMIQAMKLYNYGNLAVRLEGLNTPVMLTLIPGQKAVDYRVDLRVQGYGPNAKSMPMEEGLPPSASDVLLHVLDGVPPAGSTRLVVSGGDARAWLLDNKMFVRTNLTILSPGWIGSMTSADGTHAYEMQKSPVLLVSWHGKVMQLKIEGL